MEAVRRRVDFHFHDFDTIDSRRGWPAMQPLDQLLHAIGRAADDYFDATIFEIPGMSPNSE